MQCRQRLMTEIEQEKIRVEVQTSPGWIHTDSDHSSGAVNWITVTCSVVHYTIFQNNGMYYYVNMPACIAQLLSTIMASISNYVVIKCTILSNYYTTLKSWYCYWKLYWNELIH